MELVERFTQDIIKILHNSKNSVLRDVSKWNKEYTEHPYPQLAVEGQHHELLYEASKKYEQEENPSIFGSQPVSEYSQQPVPENNEPVAEDDVEQDDTPEQDSDELEETEDFPEHQLPKDQRDALQTKRRAREIERHRSNFDGMPRNQR